VSHFVVVYDRASGSLIRLDRFAGGSEALEARFRAEAEFRGRPDVEVVALAAESEEELRRTHGRYFLGLDELAARLG